MKPTYNSNRANGWDIERYKKAQKEYQKSDKFKESQKKYQKSDKGKEAHKESQKKYNKSDKGKEAQKKAQNKYYNQLCIYNGETITLRALRERFKRQGIDHPVLEAKKYLLH